MQALFLECGAVRVFLDMVCQHRQFNYEGNYFCRKLFSALIYFFLELLEGGNVSVQNAFYDYFREEKNSERLFRIISELMEQKIQEATHGRSNYAEINLCMNNLEFAYRPRDKVFGEK